jgi:hypothetical protein
VLIIAAGTLAPSPAAAASAASLNARSDRVALGAFRDYLQSLVSSGPAWRRADVAYVASIKHFLAAEGRLLSVAPSELCPDARALAARHGKRTPPATRQWVSR